jgi:transcriptional regulator with XRE-family HTH domain
MTGQTTEMALRSRLVEARIAAKKTQVQAAAHLGRPQSYISKLETGDLQRAPFIAVVQLAGIYGVPLTHFAEVVT